MNFKMSFLKNLIFVIPYLLLVFFLGYLPWTYSHNIEKLIQFPHYSWILLVATVVFLLTSFIDNNAITRLLVPFTKIKIKYWGGFYIALLALFVGVTIYKESYRDSMFLIFSIVVSCFSAMIAALYGGLINKKKIIKGLAIISAFLISILVWIAESYSSYYSGVEIGAIQAATLYQNTVKSIILTNPEAEVQEKKILEFSKNVSGASIETVVYKNGKVFIKPVTNKRPGYILSENAKLMKFDDNFGNKYQVYYQFYNRPELTSGLKSDNWGGLTKAVIFSANEAYEADTDSKGNVKRDDKGNIIFKDNTYFFKKESYLRSLNLWWMFWLMYGLFIYGFYHYHEKVGALGARDKALEEARIANQKQKESLEEARIANQKQNEAILDRDHALENERIANQRYKEALEEARIANRKQKEAYDELEAASQAKSLAIKEKEEAYQKQKEAYAELEDYKIYFDDMRRKIDDKISDSRNTLQLVDSSWSKIAQDANQAVLDGYKSKRHDTFNYLMGKLKTWGKEEYEKELDTPEYKQELENYLEDIQVIDQTYYMQKERGQSFLKNTYNVILNPWLNRIRKDLKNLDDIFVIVPTNITVGRIVQELISEKTLKKIKCNINLANDLNREAECCIIIDKLQSMVYNLLENSSQAGDRYYEKLRAKDRKLARSFKTVINLNIKEIEIDSKKYLSVDVQDNCGGFPPEFEDKIYVEKVKSSKATNLDHGNGTYLIGRFAKRMGIIIQHQTIALGDKEQGARTTLLIPYV